MSLRIFRLASLGLLISAAFSQASAEAVTYTFSGGLGAVINNVAFGNSGPVPFTWTVTADTASIVTRPSNVALAGALQITAITSTITIAGAGTFSFPGSSLYYYQGTNLVQFGYIGNDEQGTLNFIGLTPAGVPTGLAGWNLASPIGPVPGAVGSTPGRLTAADGSIINFTGTAASGATFQASVAPPSITSVENAASNISPGLPNAGIAQGGIFLVFGHNLGPDQISIASLVFESTTLSNTSVAVTVGATTVNALMYYTSAGQVAALLPSNTPSGSGTVTVTSNGQTSAPAPITVVANNPGIFTLSSNGQGPGIVTYADYSLVSASKAANCGGPNTTCGAANPGDTLILWATGLGPVSGSDASGVGLGVPMPNIPLKLWLGGIQAPVVYQGRSGCCIGEDQIVFTVPSNVPTGCAVPLLIQINNEISNNTVMPVAVGTRICTPANPALASINLDQEVAAGPITYGEIRLSRDSNSNGTGYQDDANLQFLKLLTFTAGSAPFFESYVDDLPPGTCIVSNSLSPGSSLPVATNAKADAGSSFTVSGPSGIKVLTGTPGQLTATLSATGNYLSPGAYTITGTGGADVGAFSANVSIPAPPTLTNPSGTVISSLTRSSPMTVAWTGGASNGVVQIQVSGATDNTYTTGATAICTAPASAGTITIPSYALLALPAGNFGAFTFTPQTAEVPFTAKGLNAGIVNTSNAISFIGNVPLK